MAVENPNVIADAIEAQEFPELARQYRVMGVPKIVINEAVEIVGAVPEQDMVAEVLRAAGVEVA